MNRLGDLIIKKDLVLASLLLETNQKLLLIFLLDKMIGNFKYF